MNLRLILILCVVSNYMSAQKFLVLKNGQKIQYISLKLHEQLVTIKTLDKKKTDLKAEEILGRYDLNAQKYFHLLPVSPAPTGTIADFGRMNRDYDFIERIYEGTINFYERVTATQGAPMPMAGGGYMSTASNKIEFFVEKDGDISEVKFRSGVLPAIRKKRIDSLSSLMDDCPEIAQKLNDENFEFGHDNIINLIRSYNVCLFKSEPWPLQKTSTVIMYSRVKQGNDQKISISINDSTLAYIPVNGTIAINISSTHPNKVCVASGDLKTCDIILSSQYFVKQFEVMLNNKKRKLEIEQKTFEEAQKYIMEVRKSRVGGN